jgi:amino acid transporter
MKPQQEKASRPSPAKELGLPELIAIGVGGMIGGGVFSVLGLAVDISGHAAPFAFLIGSTIAAVAGYSYVRLALTYHSDGASFTYLERAFPQVPSIAGIVGWTVVIGYIGTLALYAFTFGAYSAHLFGLNSSAVARWLLSTGSLLLFLIINKAGASKMGKAEDIAVYTKILLLVLLTAVGFFTVDTSRMRPLLDHGGGAVLLGGAVIFVAYEGFQLITNAVCEVRHPERDIPRGLYGSIAITSFIYVGIAFVAVGNLDVSAIHASEEYALAAVAQPILGRIGVVLVDVAAMLATASAINATVFGASHMAFEMSHDNLAPKAFSFRNRTGVPTTAAIVITLLAALLSALGGLELIASFSSLTFLLVSIAVCVANLKLRNITQSTVIPIALGIALMSATVLLLVIYMARNNAMALYFAMCVYGLAAVTFELFRWYRNRKARSDKSG